jgi:starch synthase
MNIMKVALESAQRVVAVSHGYAWECLTPEGGWGLHEILGVGKWKLRGIVNGIDIQEWNPDTDPALQVRQAAEGSNLNTARVQCGTPPLTRGAAGVETSIELVCFSVLGG